VLQRRTIGPPATNCAFVRCSSRGGVSASDCDSAGNVDLDALSERALQNYLYARTVIGCEFFIPVVRARDLH
jgi:hypothetical protein